MTNCTYRFSFPPEIELDEVRLTFQIAMPAVEGLFGQARVRLDFAFHVDFEQRTILADASTDVGAAIVGVFGAILIHEFGPSAFQVERSVAPAYREFEAPAA